MHRVRYYGIFVPGDIEENDDGRAQLLQMDIRDPRRTRVWAGISVFCQKADDSYPLLGRLRHLRLPIFYPLPQSPMKPRCASDEASLGNALDKILVEPWQNISYLSTRCDGTGPMFPDRLGVTWLRLDDI